MIDSISLNINGSWYILIPLILMSGLFTYYLYKITIPKINRRIKWLLISLRTLSLIIILFLFFEPILAINSKREVNPTTLVFIDNSGSMSAASNTKILTEDFLKKWTNLRSTDDLSIFLFGDSTRELTETSRINFSDKTSNFTKIIDKVRESEENITSVLLVSDGIITDGVNPINGAEKLGIPFYTIGLGDTTKNKDLILRNIVYDKNILSNSYAPIIVSLEQRGFNGSKVTASLLEDNRLIEQKDILLDDNNSQTFLFNYTAKIPGEKKLTLKLSTVENEKNPNNNSKTFFVTVLENRKNIVLISSSPSSDLTFIKNSLFLDSTLSVKTITEIGAGRFLEGTNIDKVLDSAGIIFLLGFPSRNTSNDIVNKVTSLINKNKIPYFILFNNLTDLNKVKSIENELPFTIVSSNIEAVKLVQPSVPVNQLRNPILQSNSINTEDGWNSLPPIFRTNIEIRPKPESEVVSNVSINNVPLNLPLILTRDVSSKKSIAVLGFDIWRWKLMKPGTDIFDRFILNSQRWLSVKADNKQVKLETSKQVYSSGEEITLLGEVRDKSQNAVENANVKVDITSPTGLKLSINLVSLGNGLYQSNFISRESGDYSFTGEAHDDGLLLGKDGGRFTVSDQELELLNTAADIDFLRLLANRTNGEFFMNEDYDKALPLLEKLNSSASNEVSEIKEYSPLSSLTIILLLIVIFALEWFIRKRYGLL
ncbi:MAG TPA: VWA domain-containing protein [Ignavibacteriaceae bacterium]|nr:VWA domain-containing protein [Ignavibacteriaceae bacterium]